MLVDSSGVDIVFPQNLYERQYVYNCLSLGFPLSLIRTGLQVPIPAVCGFQQTGGEADTGPSRSDRLSIQRTFNALEHRIDTSRFELMRVQQMASRQLYRQIHEPCDGPVLGNSGIKLCSSDLSNALAHQQQWNHHVFSYTFGPFFDADRLQLCLRAEDDTRKLFIRADHFIGHVQTCYIWNLRRSKLFCSDQIAVRPCVEIVQASSPSSNERQELQKIRGWLSQVTGTEVPPRLRSEVVDEEQTDSSWEHLDPRSPGQNRSVSPFR